MICIFGASSDDIDGKYAKAVEKLGEKLALRGHTLMYGGGASGLMAASARGFKAGNGRITGVAPRFFDHDGILCGDCDEFIYTESMRDRKKYMEDNSDAFIVSPGGIGTYEEFFEVLTLKSLNCHSKPIALFNVDGFFDKLTELIGSDVESGFIGGNVPSLIGVYEDIDALIEYIER